MPLGIGDHPLDLGLIQGGGLGDRDPLLGPGVLVPGRYVEYPVGVDVEGDLNLRYPPRRRPDVLEPEPAENAVVSGPLPLALQDDDVHGGLVVFGGGEHLGAAGRGRGGSRDHPGYHPAQRLRTQRQRGGVQQEDGLELALQDRRLDRRAGPQVDAVVPLDLVGQVVHDARVEVVAAQVRVSRRRAYLDDTLTDVENAHIEGPAAQVEDQHGLVLLLVQAIGQRGRGGLVDDPQYLKARDLARILGRLALRVVEVRRHRDDRLGDLLADLLPRVIGQLPQDQRRDFLGRVEPAGDLEPHRAVRAGNDIERDRGQLTGHFVVAAADEPLGRVNRALRVQDRLPPGQLAYQPLTLRGKGHHRRRGA